MGTLNILKANFTGQVGNMVGANWKGKPVLKAKVEGKAPPTASQTANVRAFEALNRLSAVAAAHWWQFFGLSDRKMHKHNAMASHFKPLIADHTFFPPAFIDVLKPDERVLMQRPAQASPGEPVTVNFTIQNAEQFPAGTHIQCIVVDSMGNCGYPFQALINEGPFLLAPPVPQLFQTFVIAFCSYPTESGNIIFGGNAMEVNIMKYSLDEQLTGDTWLDNRPIYQRTWAFTMPANGAVINFDVGDGTIDPIACESVVKRNDIGKFIVTNPVFLGTTGANIQNNYRGSVSVTCETSSLRIALTCNTTWLANAPGYVTVRYVKTTDL
jgi:hypothetical protein